MSVKSDLAKILLTAPACTEINEKVALSRRIDKHWRLVGELCSITSHRTVSHRVHPLFIQAGAVYGEELYLRLRPSNQSCRWCPRR